MYDDNRATRRELMTAVGAAGLLAGCLGDDGDGGDGSAEALEGDELLERAREEGAVSVATSDTGMEAFFEAFDDEYPEIEVEWFRAAGSDLRPRLLTEHSRDRMTFDVVAGGSLHESCIQFAEEGVLEAFTPAALPADADRTRLDGTVHQTYGERTLTFLYNEDRVADPPETFEGAIESVEAGRFGHDVRFYYQLPKLARRHGEERAIELLSRMGEKTAWYESVFTLAQDIAAGELDMGLSYYKYPGYEWGGPLGQRELDGLPAEYTVGNIARTSDAPHPHAGHVFVNFYLDRILEYMRETVSGGSFHPVEDVQARADDETVFEYSVETMVELAAERPLEEWETEWRRITGIRN